MDEYMKYVDNNTFNIFLKNKEGYNTYAAKAHPSYTWKEALLNKLNETNNLATNAGNGRLFTKCRKIAESNLNEYDKINQVYFLKRSFFKGTSPEQLITTEYEYAEKLTNVSDNFYKVKNKEMLAQVMRQLDWQSKEWPPNMLAKLDSLKGVYSKDKKYSHRMTMMAASHLNSQAWHVFENNGDKWEEALPWAKKAYELAKESENSIAATGDTYANLLFVTGNKAKAIKIEKEAIKQAKANKEDFASYVETLKKFEGK